MARYAERTSVDAGRTVQEIERLVGAHGATSWAYGRHGAAGMVSFDLRGRRLRFVVPLPDPQARAFRQTPTGLWRSDKAATEAYQQAVRQRWRALLLVIRAKLEAVEGGLYTLEQAFATDIVLPGGETVGERVVPQLARALEGGPPPSLLPGLPEPGDGEPGPILLPAAGREE